VKSIRCLAIITAVLFMAGAASAKTAIPAKPRTIYSVMQIAWKERNIFVDIRYPQFGKPVLDKLLKDKALSGLAAFLKDARDYQADDEKDGGGKREYAYFIDFDIHMLNTSVLSLIYNVFVDYAGAHPTTMMMSVAADMRTGKPITLDDIFKPESNYLSVISKQTIAGLTATLNPVNKETITTGAGPAPANYSVFYFRPEQIVFCFNPYQVASYADGPQESVLNLWEEPYSSIVKPDLIKNLHTAFK
jgi:hypothetical protein